MGTRIVAGVMVAIGLVWIGQGVGLIGGSFMTGEAIWAVIGTVLILFAVALLKGAPREPRRDAGDQQ